MKPEESAKVVLSGWLLKNWIDVWWEQRNSHGYKTFSVKGTHGRRPDMILKTVIDNYFVVEVKTGEESRSLMSASKILDYYSDFVSGKAKYFVNNKEIEPSLFLIATKYSVDGKLFENDSLIQKGETSTGRLTAQRFGSIPKNEYRRSSDFVRTLWQTSRWKKIKHVPYGVGIVLSESSIPVFFVNVAYKKSYHDQNVVRPPFYTLF